MTHIFRFNFGSGCLLPFSICVILFFVAKRQQQQNLKRQIGLFKAYKIHIYKWHPNHRRTPTEAKGIQKIYMRIAIEH